MAQSDDLSDRDYRTLAQFRHALRVFMRTSEDAARAAGLTPAQHQLLLAVRGHVGDHGPSISDVAEMLQQKTHSVVELADRAEDAGLIQRSPDPADGRRKMLSLTPHGEDLLAQLSLFHRDELRRFRHEMTEILRELQ